MPPLGLGTFAPRQAAPRPDVRLARRLGMSGEAPAPVLAEHEVD